MKVARQDVEVRHGKSEREQDQASAAGSMTSPTGPEAAAIESKNAKVDQKHLQGTLGGAKTLLWSPAMHFRRLHEAPNTIQSHGSWKFGFW
jgi:hypothetical protein